MKAPRTSARPDYRSLQERLQDLLADWKERYYLGFKAVDPRTPHQREAGARRLERELEYARIWLHAHAAANRDAQGTSVRDDRGQPLRPQLRVIAGGRR